MSKSQTLIGLLIFLVILCSMDMIFGNPIRETFRGPGGGRIGIAGGHNIAVNSDNGTVGSTLDYILPFRINKKYGNRMYAKNNTIPNIVLESDDQPLFYGF